MSSNTAALGKIETKNRSDRSSQRNLARAAGVLYLIIITAGIFAEFFVRQSLKVPGDAAATAGNIMAAEGLFRLGISADLIMIIADVALALVFYELFKPVSKSLSLMAAFFRLAQAAVLGINLLNLLFVLQILSGAEFLAVLGEDQLNALAMLFLDAHAVGYSLGLIFFGLNLLILGYLVWKSGYLPRILGILLIAASLGYLIDTFAKVLLPDYAAYEMLFTLVVFMPAFISELALALWLLFKGVKDSRQDESIPLNSPHAESIAT